MMKMKDIYSSLINVLNRNEMRILPGQIAFYFLMSIIPIAALILFVGSIITVSYDLLDLFDGTIPVVVVDTLNSMLSGAFYDDFGLLLICYIFLASNGPGAIIIASNSLYEIKQPSYFRRKIKSIVMTLLIVLLLLFIITIPLFGQFILKSIFSVLNLSQLFIDFSLLYKFLEIIISFIIIYFFIKLIYVMSPDAVIKSRTTTLGAVVSTISWIVSTQIFSFYITEIAKYDVIYGNFANVLISLLWLYLLAYFFVLGMGINANNYLLLKKEVENENKNSKS